MDTLRLRTLVQEELRHIIRIQHLIQIELDELNTLTKENGSLDIAVKEGIESLKLVASTAKIPIDNDAIAAYKKRLETDLNAPFEI